MKRSLAVLVLVSAALPSAAGWSPVRIEGGPQAGVCGDGGSPAVYGADPGPIYCWIVASGNDGQILPARPSGFFVDRDPSTGGLVALRPGGHVIGAASVLIPDARVAAFIAKLPAPDAPAAAASLAEHRLGAARNQEASVTNATMEYFEKGCREAPAADRAAKCARRDEVRRNEQRRVKAEDARTKAFGLVQGLSDSDRRRFEAGINDPRTAQAVARACGEGAGRTCRKAVSEAQRTGRLNDLIETKFGRDEAMRRKAEARFAGSQQRMELFFKEMDRGCSSAKDRVKCEGDYLARYVYHRIPGTGPAKSPPQVAARKPTRSDNTAAPTASTGGGFFEAIGNIFRSLFGGFASLFRGGSPT